MARQHHKYKMKRIIIHFVRPIIENLVFISGFQRANLYRFIGYRNIGKDCFIGTNVYLDEVNPLGICIGQGVHSYSWNSDFVPLLFIER